MEQRNLFMAIALSMLVILLWHQFFTPKEQNVAPVEPQKKEVVEKSAAGNPSFDANAANAGAAPATEVKITKISTPLYTLEISNQGAVIKQINLKNYKENNTKDSETKHLFDKSIDRGSYDIAFRKNTVKGIENAVFTLADSSDEITVKDKPETLTFAWTSPDGIVIEKTYEFRPDTYLIAFNVAVKNGSGQNVNDDIVVNLHNKVVDSSNFAATGPALFMGKKRTDVAVKKIEKENQFSGNVDWMSIHDRYFMVGLIPENPANTDVQLTYDKTTEIIGTSMIKSLGDIAPGTQKTMKYDIYAGPMSLESLKKAGHNMEKAVDFGMFGFIAKPCLMLMIYIHDHVIHNYGVAIIILTVLIKIILWPLGTKSYTSMNDMKKIQPLMTEIREKYKNDNQKMNAEMMNLYKTYKVNPLSGCLPMLAQMPIFFAFYKMLYTAIELRHAPFYGWITDLSAPDRLFHFNVTIPYFQPPTGIPVLTLLMGASMFLQQKMSPPAGDPAQARMMMFMPVFMTFIFINFSSGLVLYWLVNNILSISQQYYIMKK